MSTRWVSTLVDSIYAQKPFISFHAYSSAVKVLTMKSLRCVMHAMLVELSSEPVTDDLRSYAVSLKGGIGATEIKTNGK
jgi:hypothetical protein